MQSATKYGQLFEERCDLPLCDAALEYQRQLQNDRTNVDLWVLFSSAMLDYQRMYREASEAMSTGLSYDPFHFTGHMSRGFMYIKMHRFAQAAVEYAFAAKLRPMDKEPLYYLAMMYFYLEDYESADRIYDRMWQMGGPRFNECALTTWQWFTLMCMGNREKAQQILKRITLNHMPLRSVGPLGNEYYDQCYFIFCLMFKGVIAPEAILEDAQDKDAHYFAMMAFYVAVYCEFNGREAEALTLYREMIRRLGEDTPTVLVVQMQRRAQRLAEKLNTEEYANE